jgi:anti-sigma factor RsiW
MPDSSTCPAEHELRQFSLGLLPEAVAERVEQHLAQCAGCLRTLNDLAAEDTVTASLRARGATPPPPPPLPRNAVLEGLLEQMRALPAVASSVLKETAEGSGPPGETPSGDAPSGETQEVLSFLAPPQAPGEIGRLGGYRVLAVLGQGAWESSWPRRISNWGGGSPSR